MPFVKGHKKTGGRKAGGTNKQRTLQENILAALDVLGGQAYIEMLGREHPHLLVALLGRVLPLTVAGDKDRPLAYEVTLQFGDATAAPLVEAKKAEAVSGEVLDFPKLLHMPEK